MGENYKSCRIVQSEFVTKLADGGFCRYVWFAVLLVDLDGI